MIDFTIQAYRRILKALQQQGFSFLTFEEFVKDSSGNKNIALRHDVDFLPANSLQFARIQAELGIKGTYYFRIISGSFDERIIEEISSLGHEIGYHYEDLSFADAKLRAQGAGHRAQGEEIEKKLVNIGIQSFIKNLEKLRRIVPVKTICMHGSPLSKWDSRLLWKYYDYHDFGIVGEPYFDIDFKEVLYLTDTGRRWDGGQVSIRDKAQGTGLRAEGMDPYKDWKVKPIGISGRKPHAAHRSEAEIPLRRDRTPFSKFHSTLDIIKAAEEGLLPDKILMTFHPQRWSDKTFPWVKELAWQNVKNIAKYFLVKLRN